MDPCPACLAAPESQVRGEERSACLQCWTLYGTRDRTPLRRLGCPRCGRHEPLRFTVATAPGKPEQVEPNVSLQQVSLLVACEDCALLIDLRELMGEPPA